MGKWFVHYCIIEMAIFKKENENWGMRLTISHEILRNEQFEGPEFIDDKSFLWFLTAANVGTCHLSGHGFGPKPTNFPISDEILYFAQTKNCEFKLDNSFFLFLTPVSVDNCQYWYLLLFRHHVLIKNSKCSSFDRILYFTQNEGAEFNGFNIERCNWVPKRIKTWNRKTNLVSKIIAYLNKVVPLM